MGNIFWMIYLGILGTAAICFLIKGVYKTVMGKLDFVISIITWIGLFGFVTNTSIFTPLVWKFLFGVAILWDIIFSFLKKDYDGEDTMEGLSETTKNVITAITLIITLGPLYYGLFHYAFLWK